MVLAHCLAAFEPSLYARSALAVVELIKKADKSTVTQVSVFEELAQRFLLQVRVLLLLLLLLLLRHYSRHATHYYVLLTQ